MSDEKSTPNLQRHPADQAGLRSARESWNPVNDHVCAFTPAVDHWIRLALARQSRDDSRFECWRRALNSY
jgi:hypothetical protein